MENTGKFALVAAVLGLLAFWCYQRKKEGMHIGSLTSMPTMGVATTTGTDTGGLRPADNDEVPYGPFPGAAQPCTTAVPYA